MGIATPSAVRGFPGSNLSGSFSDRSCPLFPELVARIVFQFQIGVLGRFGAVVIYNTTTLSQISTLVFMSEAELRSRMEQMQAAKTATHAKAMITAKKFKPLAQKAL